MFLFKDVHIRMILAGTKTQTRRNHKTFRARVGSIHQVRSELFGMAHCRIRILRRWEEPLGAISPEDARAEGLYLPEEYIAGMIEMHKGRLTRESVIKCYEFELVQHGTTERPDYVPADWLFMYARDGCTYWVNPTVKNNPDYFFPCQIAANDDTKDDEWHCATELSELVRE